MMGFFEDLATLERMSPEYKGRQALELWRRFFDENVTFSSPDDLYCYFCGTWRAFDENEMNHKQ